MMNVLLLGYIAILALFVWLGLIPFNRFWKFSPLIVAIALVVGLFIPMGWGAPSGAALVGRNSVQPSIQVLHAPVFYGYTFAAVAELNSKSSKDALVELCRKAGFTLEPDPNSPLGNLNASGDSAIHLALPESDPAQPGTWWFWGAADNVRVPANIAVKLAEKLVE